MINLKAVFQKAWKETKVALAVADAFLQKNQASINADVQVGVKVVDMVEPQLAPVANTFGSIEEAALGEITAFVHTVNQQVQNGIGIPANGNGGQLSVTFSTELSDIFRSLTSLVSRHPDVVAASASSK